MTKQTRFTRIPTALPWTKEPVITCGWYLFDNEKSGRPDPEDNWYQQESPRIKTHKQNCLECRSFWGVGIISLFWDTSSIVQRAKSACLCWLLRPLCFVEKRVSSDEFDRGIPITTKSTKPLILQGFKRCLKPCFCLYKAELHAVWQRTSGAQYRIGGDFVYGQQNDSCGHRRRVQTNNIGS